MTQKEENLTKLSHSMAHYLFTIHAMNEDKVKCRAVHVAEALKVARSTVTLALRRLKQHKLLQEDDTHFIFLTAKGHRLIHQVLLARTLLHCFFENVLKIPRKQALQQACKIENLLSPASCARLFEFLKNNIASCKHCRRDVKNSSVSVICLKDYQTFKEFQNFQKQPYHSQLFICEQIKRTNWVE